MRDNRPPEAGSPNLAPPTGEYAGSGWQYQGLWGANLGTATLFLGSTLVSQHDLCAPAGSCTSTSAPVELPFTGLSLPADVAVDKVGNVYVADLNNNRVLKLPAGSNTQVELPFTGLNYPEAVAGDIAGNVYVADSHNNRVLKLPAKWAK